MLLEANTQALKSVNVETVIVASRGLVRVMILLRVAWTTLSHWDMGKKGTCSMMQPLNLMELMHLIGLSC